jgi:hypothetical protein
VFLFAVLWKLMTPEYMSGKFLEFFLLTDGRVAPVAVMLTPLTLTEFRNNKELLSQLPDAKFQLTSAPNVHALALWLTFLTLLVEGLVALIFLLPTKPVVRDVALTIFLVSGYLTVTVPSFGMMFATLGFAQTENQKFQLFYKAACILLPLISIRYYLSA